MMKNLRYGIVFFGLMLGIEFAIAQDDISDATPPAPYGAKVFGLDTVPNKVDIACEFSSEFWDVGRYFDIADPTVIRVPYQEKMGGRYEIHVEVHWINPLGSFGKASFFHSYVTLNGVNNGSDGWATTNMVWGATETTQHFSLEMNLNMGDEIELVLGHSLDMPVSARVFLTVTHRPM